MDAFEQLVSEILWMDGYWVSSRKGSAQPVVERESAAPLGGRAHLGQQGGAARLQLLRSDIKEASKKS
jgi:hypothetical protein